MVMDDTVTDGNSDTIDWRQALRVEDLIDVKDEAGKWYEGTIRAIRSDCLLIHQYNRWPLKWDEWIEIDSDRLERVHTYTNGRNTSD